MRKFILIPLAALTMGLGTLNAQMVGANTFLQGNYVEVGISQCGVYGTPVVPPAGYHPSPFLPGMGFVADPDRDGWASTAGGGLYNYCGDYFVPGSPVEGWSLTFNGTDYINTNTGCTTFNIPGSNVALNLGTDEDTATWVGSVAGMTVIQQTLVPADSLYFLTRMKLINTTASTITGVYYGRNVDPDQEQPWSGSFTTNNRIVSQPVAGVTSDALVLSVGMAGYCFLGLGSQDDRARVNYGGFATVPADDLYFGVSRTTTTGSSVISDIANGIGFSLGDINAGDSVTFSFVYILDTADLADAMLRTAPDCAAAYTSLTVSTCAPYDFGGTTLTSSGVYTQNLFCACGADSTVTLNLTVGAPGSSSVSVSSCDSYLFDGTLYTTSGTYTGTFTNASGCDSTVTLTLTIEAPTSSSLNVSTCEPYLFEGTLLTSSGIYTAVLTNAAGCDSTVTLTLAIEAPTSSSLNVTTCEPYLFEGTLLTSSGIYTAVLTNAAGCDSTITLDLTITPTDVSVTLVGGTLTAAASGITYQWVDCDLGYAAIAGATSQSFTPPADGHYAVVLTNGTCVDTSACTEVLVTSVNAPSGASLNLYPNPLTGNTLTMTLTPASANMSIEIMNYTGQLVWSKQFSNTTTVTADLTTLVPGVYFVKAKSGEMERTIKVLKM